MYANNNSYYRGQCVFIRPIPYDNSAIAIIKGGPDYPGINGFVTFRNALGGTWICANIAGLPPYKPGENGKQPIGPFGFHIHENGNCSVGDPSKPFEASGGHWNPTNQPHGNHYNRGI